MSMVFVEQSGSVLSLTLNDPSRRNALGESMFSSIEDALQSASCFESAYVLHLRAAGTAFCSGFDLAAAVEQPTLLPSFIHRLSGVIRSLRRLPMVVLAEVQGAALAGGCAMLTGCDLVIASPGARFGYPVHALGISPAVTIPTLSQLLTPGSARSLLMGGRIISADEAENLGLVTRTSATDTSLAEEAQQLAAQIAGHGPAALRATKNWLNELDGSLDDARFAGPTQGSARQAVSEPSVTMLQEAWRRRRA